MGQETTTSIARPSETANQGVRLGTFMGVFTPTVLTILGAIMYLREGWVVGNAGLIGGLLIILLAHVITVSTTLSVVTIATNIRVGAGGAYAMITQSLGIEAGGSIGLPLYLAQVSSAVLYVLAFAEGWSRVAPHPEWLVALISFLFVVGITSISTTFAQRIQVVILAVVVLSVISFVLGVIPMESVSYFDGWIKTNETTGLAHDVQLWGDFKDGTFWATFAIFFPAVTGIVAGISLSDCLEEPRVAIPRGALWGVGLTMIVYLALAYLLSRMASPDELVENKTIMVDKAVFGPAIIAGLLGATFSSALGSIVAAPRVLAALASHKVVPFSDTFAKMSKSGEPRFAQLFTCGLTLVTLFIAVMGGGLDFVAPLITMFFLLTYGILNLVVFVEQRLDMISFRPTFSIPRIVPLIGMGSCGFVMFLVSPVFSLLAVIFSLVVYFYLLRKDLGSTEEGDVRSGLFTTVAEWAAGKAVDLPAAPERTWQPNVLAPVRHTDELRGSYRLLRAITKHGAVRALGIYPPEGREDVEGLTLLARDFSSEGIFAKATLLEQPEFVSGTAAAIELLRATFFPPNVLFLRHQANGGTLEDLGVLMKKATEQGMGVMLMVPHQVVELGQEQRINVWIRDQSPDWELGLRLGNDLTLLLAYELARSWKGRMCLCMAVGEASHKPKAEAYLQDLIDLARFTKICDKEVYVGAFADAVKAVERADVTLLGLAEEPDVKGIKWVIEQVRGSCIFVRDSGNESVLA